MSSVSPNEIKQEFLKSKIGITGIVILLVLVAISIGSAIVIPVETFQQWNNPQNWILYPKTAIPSWVNLFKFEKIPEHKILDSPYMQTISQDEITAVSHQFQLNYMYDDFPSDFIYEFTAKYTGSPLLQISVIRPDGINLKLFSRSLPYSDDLVFHNEKIFSTDESIKKSLFLQSEVFDFLQEGLSAEDIVFSESSKNVALKGNYMFLVNLYGVQKDNSIEESTLIVGGKAFGIMGTDELRRDLAVGILWGTPLALFIGIAVAIGSVVMGLVYGVYAGFKGKLTDESMMRFNDVIYALPVLPFLIILAVTISNSIFVMIGFLTIFGWVGIAKVSRSMALQIKTKGYVEASKMMGQKNSKIIFKHIIPQLLPYAFASIAISVPAAITTEAGLSFLGLGDPSFPTWGQILHDANTHGAAARGLWWWIVPPGLMIAITGLAFVFLGNALDSIVNPKLKR
ncbi:MAG TPA: ABC transporter permease [Nitrosopumilaceae archaeon]|nr:ABC transporter permease [Nitrosopumilaceae archaeon]